MDYIDNRNWDLRTQVDDDTHHIHNIQTLMNKNKELEAKNVTLEFNLLCIPHLYQSTDLQGAINLVQLT